MVTAKILPVHDGYSVNGGKKIVNHSLRKNRLPRKRKRRFRQTYKPALKRPSKSIFC